MHRREFIGRFGVAAVGAICRSSLSYAQAPFAGAKVTVPALYMAGDRDLALAFQGMDRVVANLANSVPQLRGKVIFPGCGHWTQQERASEVNAAMIDFLREL
jgi:pimeloyl-ACP methyl ester carboxylesterase